MNMVKLKQNLSSDLDLISRGYPGEPEYVTGLMTIIYTRGECSPDPFFCSPEFLKYGQIHNKVK